MNSNYEWPYLVKCETCDEKVRTSSAAARTLAHEDGWLLTRRTGQYCPSHWPSWGADYVMAYQDKLAARNSKRVVKENTQTVLSQIQESRHALLQIQELRDRAK